MRDGDPIRSYDASQDVLMHVVRELDRKFMRPRRDRKLYQRSSTRGDIRVTTEAEGRLVADKNVALVTVEARSVTGKRGDIREAARRDPVRARHGVTC